MIVTTENKDYAGRLTDFLSVLLSNKEIAKIEPIIYGSLAYFYYTNDSEIKISDIDVLISKDEFPILTSALDHINLKYEVTTYDSIKVFRDDLKISFDAKENYLSNLSDDSVEDEINGINLRIISIATLTEVYHRGATTIPSKKQAYEYKLLKLLNLQ